MIGYFVGAFIGLAVMGIGSGLVWILWTATSQLVTRLLWDLRLRNQYTEASFDDYKPALFFMAVGWVSAILAFCLVSSMPSSPVL